MRVEYKVAACGGGWKITRGHTRPLEYASFDRAIGIAESMARAAAEHGDSAVVKVVSADGAIAETRQFAPKSIPSSRDWRLSEETGRSQLP